MTVDCEECNARLGGCFSAGASACTKCEKMLCSKCAGKHPLIPFDAENSDESNDLARNGTVKTFCKTCFQATSVVDFSKTYDVVQGAKSAGRGDLVTFLMVHGGGATRALFRPYADILASKGFQSILMDLPGHGSLIDSPLTLDNCVKTVAEILGNEKLERRKVIYVGGSLGAYIGFYVLDKLKDRFCGAVLMDCGQNVGPDCSIKASLGIQILRLATKTMSNKGLLGAMIDVTKKSPADWRLVECTFGAGLFFDQGTQQIECMHSVKPADHIPTYHFPVLFFNGSEDYRDSENKWLSLCKNQEKSSLKVYEGGDHFFTHDSRFVDDVIDRIMKFAFRCV